MNALLAIACDQRKDLLLRKISWTAYETDLWFNAVVAHRLSINDLDKERRQYLGNRSMRDLVLERIVPPPTGTGAKL